MMGLAASSAEFPPTPSARVGGTRKEHADIHGEPDVVVVLTPARRWPASWQSLSASSRITSRMTTRVVPPPQTAGGTLYSRCAILPSATAGRGRQRRATRARVIVVTGRHPSLSILLADDQALARYTFPAKRIAWHLLYVIIFKVPGLAADPASGTLRNRSGG